MNDLISRLASQEKMGIDEIAELMQGFIADEKLEEKFYQKTGKGRPFQMTYEEFEAKCGLRPFAEFHAEQIRNNKLSMHPDECQGQRQSGRTTNLLVNAILVALKGGKAVVYSPSLGIARKLVLKCEELLKKAGIAHSGTTGLTNVGIGQIRFATWSQGYPEKGYRDDKCFFDNSLNDLAGS